MMTTPNRGEIWRVQFDPQVGEEIGKVRPAVVVSVSSVGRLPLRIVAPITDWKARYANYPWFIHIVPSQANGLTKESGADAFQVKSVALRRFQGLLGVLDPAQVDEIASAIAICVGVP